MTEQNTNRSVVRVKSALARQRRTLLYLLIAVALLGVAFGLTLFFTSRTAFYDPTDGTKYYVAKEDGLYVLKTTSGEVLSTTEGGNYVTLAGTIVYVDDETGAHSTVAAVLSEDGDVVKFDTSTTSYDVLLYPLLERANISEIEVHNENGSFKFIKILYKDPDTGEETTKFIIDGREDIPVDQSIIFATLIYCTGNTRTLLRLDTNRVKELGYAEYGLPEDTANATRYFVITAMDGTKHKVILGDEVPSGDGYFARYEGRDAVYVLSELTASDYNKTYADALFGKVEDYVTPPTASDNMESSNYFDITDFKLYKNGAPTAEELQNGGKKPFIAFSYRGSIDLRYNTYYASIPYTTDGDLSGYSINSYRVDDCLYTLYTWMPDFVAELGTTKDMADADINEWLKPYGLDNDSYPYRVTFTFNKDRTYNSETGKDVIKKADQEKHIILISDKQEDGYYYAYNICYVYDEATKDFTKPADGYNMIVALSEEQLGFLFFTEKDWISYDLFTGHIAYMEEMYIKIAPGLADKYPEGYEETFSLDNSDTLAYLATQDAATSQLTADKVVVRDSAMKALNAKQFKTFYSSLLYTTCSGYSSLSEEKKESYIASGAEGAALVIRIKYVLRELNEDTGYYEETGEVIVREYCFYEDLSYPRQYFTTVNGVGDFYTVSSRVKKVINDIMKLYGTPETDPIKYDSLN
ncbi:MAG: DUF4340 domain-containing protein [Clostridia bacterium]|nr:DUF4340 domain-containing protein [Clostridia bacterium]